MPGFSSGRPMGRLQAASGTTFDTPLAANAADAHETNRNHTTLFFKTLPQRCSNIKPDV
jgi:hypothetical protein